MERVVKFLSHPAWTGLAAICGFLALGATLWTIHLAYYPPPKQADSQEAPPLQEAPPRPDPSIVTTPEKSMNDDNRQSLNSIDKNYRGMHQYFNDAPSVAVLATILAVLGAAAFASNRYARSLAKV
jgi:hypothetical protein